MTAIIHIRRPYRAPLPCRGEAVPVAAGEYRTWRAGWRVPVTVAGQTGRVEGWWGVEDDRMVVMNVRVAATLLDTASGS